MTQDSEGQWHLDRRVPISIILAMLAQFAGGLWFVARLDARIIALETAQVAQAERDNRQDANHNDSLSLLRSDMRDIMARLDRLIEARHDR
ncbi:MAG: hypothetical protein MUF16_10520 [Burkholderiaceae bacterium]|jgi:hypothetical protein|nr:hypothetical protein [Burkholderiaceae bacterium]